MTTVERWLRDATFEIVPTPGIENEVSRNLPAGARVAVPHLAAYGLDRTADVTIELARRGFTAVPHIAARTVGTTAEVHRLVRRLRAAGLEEVLAVGGDARVPGGPYTDASALVTELAQMPDRVTRIGVAGHPEGHGHATADVLLDVLLRKQAIGANHVVTQMCFDAAALDSWTRSVRGAGVSLPIVLGVAGAVSRTKLIRLGLLLGVGPSMRTLRAQRGLGRTLIWPGAFSPLQFLSGLATEHPRLGETLAGLHIFTFNALDATLASLGPLQVPAVR